MKKVINIIISLLLISMFILLLDLSFIYLKNKPLIYLSQSKYTNNIKYEGIFYNVMKCSDNRALVVSKNSKFNCPMVVDNNYLVAKVTDISDNNISLVGLVNLGYLKRGETIQVRVNSISDISLGDYIMGMVSSTDDKTMVTLGYISILENYYNIFINSGDENIDIKGVVNLDGSSYKIYYVGIQEVILEIGSYKYELSEALGIDILLITDIIDDMDIYSSLTDSDIYQKDNLRIIKCHTLEGNRDIYIGNNNLEYQESYCK